MADWVTISSLATAGGTLVLAGATFVAVRSSHESARITERALLAAIRPLLLTPRLDDPAQKIRFQDAHATLLAPSRAQVEVGDNAIYLAFGLRNAGSGIAVLDRWRCVDGAPDSAALLDPSEYRRLTRDLYIPANDVGFWQGAIRDPDDPDFVRVRDLVAAKQRVIIDLLYGDYEGGQRTISRFALTSLDSGEWLTQVARHWNVDRPDPR